MRKHDAENLHLTGIGVDFKLDKLDRGRRRIRWRGHTGHTDDGSLFLDRSRFGPLFGHHHERAFRTFDDIGKGEFFVGTLDVNMTVPDFQIFCACFEQLAGDFEQSFLDHDRGSFDRIACGVGNTTGMARRIKRYGVGIGVGHSHLVGRETELFCGNLTEGRDLPGSQIDGGVGQVRGTI